MNLLLMRRWLTERSTIGELLVDGAPECFVLEDRYRLPWESKVPGQTCIPCGCYDIVITHSQRFKRELPLLLNVRNFQGVRIHPGNTDADTEGCLLPGRKRGPDVVTESKAAFDALFEKLQRAAPPHRITIVTSIT